MSRSPWLWLALALSCLQLVAFAALDRRPPDDHDDFYTADCIPWIAALREAPHSQRPGLLLDQFGSGPLHPRIAQTSLVAVLAAAGPSRAAYRLANLPFLLLLVWSTALLARELGARRPGIAALAVAVAPIVVNASRKWDIQFHAAALTPLGLYLLIAALRRGGRAGAVFWIGLGLWQALRLYSHPIVAPDVALTLILGGGLLVPTAHSLGLRPAARLGLWAAALSITAWLGLWYSGLAPGLVGSPPHHFLGYIEARESYAAGWWVAEASPVAWAGLLVRMVAEISWLHLFPSGFLLLLSGLIAAAISWRATDAGWRRDRWLLVLPVTLAAAQIAPAVLAVSNKAFLNDWLFVLPGLVAVALRAGERVFVGRIGVGLVFALLMHGAFVLAVPFVATAVGPEPVEDPAWYDRGPLRLFTRSSSGRHLITHHLPSRFDSPGAVLASRLSAQADVAEEARYDLYDLQWDPARGGGPGCQLGPASDRRAWAWSWPEGLDGVARRDPSAWPFVFEGFDRVRVGRPDQEPTSTEAPFAVVRLWVTPTDRWASDAEACRPEARLPEGWIGAARALVAERLGPVPVQLVPDPGGWLVGRVVEWDRSAAYASVALLVDRSAGQVQVEPEGDLLGDHAAPQGGSQGVPEPLPPGR